MQQRSSASFVNSRKLILAVSMTRNTKKGKTSSSLIGAIGEPASGLNPIVSPMSSQMKSSSGTFNLLKEMQRFGLYRRQRLKLKIGSSTSFRKRMNRALGKLKSRK